MPLARGAFVSLRESPKAYMEISPGNWIKPLPPPGLREICIKDTDDGFACIIDLDIAN